MTGTTAQRETGSARWTIGIGILGLALLIGAVQLVALPAANAQPPAASSESNPSAATTATVVSASTTRPAVAEAPSQPSPSVVSLAPAVGDRERDLIDMRIHGRREGDY